MNEKETELSLLLSEGDARESFIALAEGRALGASSNIRAVMAMMLDIAENREDGREAVGRICSYIDELRGDSSIAVRNAINELLSSLDGNLETMGEKEAIGKTVESYRKKMADDTAIMVRSGIETLKGKKRIFVFDYSSSVDAILLGLIDEGEEFVPVVAESRLLDGGVPFIKSLMKRGVKANFVMEACMDSAIRECDAVIIGAETVYREGSVINTAGSELAAYSAKFHGVPFYVATTFQKYDRRGERMFGSKDSTCSMENRLAGNMDEDVKAACDFTCHGFSLVPGYFVTGYFTEKGLLSRDEFLKAGEN